MANISVTYTFSNSTTADATEVNTNFTDIINGTSDGTKDFSINALTCAGAATFNGNVTLGNSSSDDVTVTGSLASSIALKTTNSHDIGNTTNGLRYLYLAAGATHVARLGAGTASADWNFTLPTSAGSKGQALFDTDGAGTLGWAPLQTDINSVSGADYTVTDTDGYRHIHVTASSSNRTVTLPTAADNSDRILTVMNMDGTANVVVDGEGAETINGATTFTLAQQYESVEILCNGTSWVVLAHRYPQNWTDNSSNYSVTGFDTVSDLLVYERRAGDTLVGRAWFTTGTTPTAVSAYLSIPYTVDTDKIKDSDQVVSLGSWQRIQDQASQTAVNADDWSGVMTHNSGQDGRLYFSKDVASNLYTLLQGNNFGGGEIINIDFKVAVTEWESP